MGEHNCYGKNESECIKKKQFGKRIGDIFIRETKVALKNNEISKAKQLLELITVTLQYVDNESFHSASTMLEQEIAGRIN